MVINYLPFDSFSIAWDPEQPFYLALYFWPPPCPFQRPPLVIGGEF